MDWNDLLEEVRREVTPEIGRGEVADYIPALAEVDPGKFAMALTTVDGEQFGVGDASEPFSLQSITKVLTLTLALDAVGERLWGRLGREPSGTPFNSLVQLEHEEGIPRNPFINAGALAVTDVVISHCRGEAARHRILRLARQLADDPTVGIDLEVARSEKEWGFRNVALANFMKSFGNLDNEVVEVLDTYFHQCALEMSCRGLSRTMLFLACGGKDPLTGQRVVSPARAKRINALMLTCGHYDASGDFAFRVGLPGKSGVGGGIVAVVPGRMAIAAWSPPLNPQGSSHAGTVALELFAERSGCSVF